MVAEPIVARIVYVDVAEESAATAHLSAAEHGAYLRLRMEAWQSGEPLPLDDRQLAWIAGADRLLWAEIKAAVVAMFVERDGQLHDEGRGLYADPEA